MVQPWTICIGFPARKHYIHYKMCKINFGFFAHGQKEIILLKKKYFYSLNKSFNIKLKLLANLHKNDKKIIEFILIYREKLNQSIIFLIEMF